MYQTERGGMPNMEVVLMIRLPVLQQWPGLSGLRWNARSRTEYLSASFQAFLRPYQTIPRPGTSENAWLKQEKTRRSGGNSRNNWTVKV